jgi:hypothetical protein
MGRANAIDDVVIHELAQLVVKDAPLSPSIMDLGNSTTV